MELPGQHREGELVALHIDTSKERIVEQIYETSEPQGEKSICQAHGFLYFHFNK